jgi:hypothetical protein
MASFTDRAKADWKRFSSDVDGWGTAIKVTTPDGLTSVDVSGIAVKHHINIDTEGLTVNGKNAHCTISEELLTDASYVVRDSDEEVNMVDHRVEWVDSSGVLKKYVIRESYPDEKVGVIVMILGDFE